MASALRTVAIQPYRGALVVVPAWPIGEPDELLDYSIDLSALLADASDTLESVSLSIRPSSAADCQATDLSVQDGVITAMLTGGIPGRAYLCKFVCTTAGGRTFEFLVWRPIDSSLAVGTAPTVGLGVFGAPVVWTAPATFGLDEGFVTILTNPGFPTAATGLWPGACWDNGGFLAVMPGVTPPDPPAPALYFGSAVANQFLWYGAGYLPLVAGASGSRQLFNNGGFVCAA